MWAFASIEGSTSIQADSRNFVEAFRRRIEAGLITGAPHPRSRYVVTRQGPDTLEFCAADWPTAVAVGLNQVELAANQPGQVRYDVRYPLWARYTAGLCAVLGIALAGFLVAFDLRGYLARHPSSSMGLSPEHAIIIAWTMALFWGFAWPWILIALHKGLLHRLMGRLITEVDTDALGRR